MTRRLITLLLLLLAAAASPRGQEAPGVIVERAWVRQPPADRRVTAAFLDINNRTDTAVRIVGARSQAAGALELHEMRQDNGMMRMAQVQGIDVPARSTVSLRPGGLHVMLFDLAAPLQAGSTVTLTLQLAGGQAIDVVAEVRAPAQQTR